ncbi:hypothetical protein F4604DRAFT_1031306 [Suillus subluteus]|nr:hypothetical protein F4604DRAFT_1031306 [Suillus subluteus]
MSFALDDCRQHTDTTNAMIANSKATFSSDIIGVLQNILDHSQVIIPDPETQYPINNTNYSAFKLDYQNISAIVTELQQQLDAVSHEISRLETVIDSINHIHQQLVAKKDKIAQSMNSHKRLVSALWRLPAEVLSQIFAHCLPIGHHLSPASKAVPMLWICPVCGTDYLWAKTGSEQPSAMRYDSSDHEGVRSRWNSSVAKITGPSYEAFFSPT